MEINTINLPLLHNEEHFQFQREIKELIEQSGAKTLDIEKVFSDYLPFLLQEEEALNLVRKSATTSQIELADKDRDELISGLIGAVKFQLKHYEEEKRAAAFRYKIVLDRYGDIANKPYDDETAAIHKLVLESKGPYATDVATITITDWIAELDKKNQFFESLKADRNSEEAQKTLKRMKIVRIDVDAAYKMIVKRINALITINGPEIHETFVRELNVRIDKISNTLAQRKGRSRKNSDKNENNSGNPGDINKE